jgi:hypothetical protein
MLRWSVAATLVVAGLLATGPARADKIGPTKTTIAPQTGARVDITVPYLTTGRSALMGSYVQPRIYSSPQVDNPANPGVRPVLNLIFYGSRMAYGDQENGAVPRPGNQMRPPRP